jgi:hypothetical protein
MNYTLLVVAILFMILTSIQFTLNKIYVVLKEIRDLLRIKKTKE